MRTLFVAFVCTFSAASSFSQDDPATLQPALAKVIAGLELKTSDDIYNGREHIGYLHTIQGIAYYKTNQWQKGSMIYRGVFYPDVYLKYDLVRDELIVRHYNGFQGVTLFSPRLQRFSMGDAHFIYLNSGNEPQAPATGIYQVIGGEALSLLIKRSKKIEETVSNTQVDRKFVDQIAFYIAKDGAYHRIRKESDVLELWKSHRSEIKSLLKAKEIKFKKNPEGALVSIIDYFNKQASH